MPTDESRPDGMCLHIHFCCLTGNTTGNPDNQVYIYTHQFLLGNQQQYQLTNQLFNVLQKPTVFVALALVSIKLLLFLIVLAARIL